MKEDNIRREEEAQLALTKKKLEEKNKLPNVNREKGTVVGNYASYNYKGKLLDVNLIEDFNGLTTKSNRKVLQVEKSKQSKQPEVTKKTPLISILGREAGFKEQMRNNSIALMKLYDNFIPSPGVELLEDGKKPKKSIRSFREKEGKMSKNELNDCDFLPKIPLPDKVKSARYEDTSLKANVFPKTVRLFKGQVYITGDLDQLIVQQNELKYGRVVSERSLNSEGHDLDLKFILPEYNSLTRGDPFFVTSSHNDNIMMRAARNKPIEKANIGLHTERGIGNKKRTTRLSFRGELIMSRNRLPPPPIGATYGHGLFKSKS